MPNFIEGLKILQPYYKDGYLPDQTDRDRFHTYATDYPMMLEDVWKMHHHGWFQIDSANNESVLRTYYIRMAGWSANL